MDPVLVAGGRVATHIGKPINLPYMKVGLSTAFWHVGPFLCLVARVRVVLWGQSDPVSQQQLHHLTCGRSDGSAPYARGVAPVRRDPPETRWLLATNEEDGRAPRIAAGYVACGNPFNFTPRSRYHLTAIAQYGRMSWQRSSGYNRRSLVETTMFRCKTVIGRQLHARTLPNQRTEAKVGCMRSTGYSRNKAVASGSPLKKRARRPPLGFSLNGADNLRLIRFRAPRVNH